MKVGWEGEMAAGKAAVVQEVAGRVPKCRLPPVRRIREGTCQSYSAVEGLAAEEGSAAAEGSAAVEATLWCYPAAVTAAAVAEVEAT